MTFLFIGVVVVDFGSNLLAGGFAPMAPMAEEVMLESAAEEMEEPVLMVEEIAEEDAAVTGEMEKAADSPPEAEFFVEGESEGASIPETQTAPEEADRATDSGEEADSDEPGELTNALSQDEESLVNEDQVPEIQESEPSFTLAQLPWITILEVAFGAGAVGFAIATWIIRRRRN
jgi:hypothetical protein